MKNENKKHVIIGTIGHVDSCKSTLHDAITKCLLSLNGEKDSKLAFPEKKEMPKLIVDPSINMLVPHELSYTLEEVVEKGKKYIKSENFKLWEDFCGEYGYFYSGMFIKRLLNVLKLLHEGITMEEIEGYLVKLPLHSKLINYISIAVIRFSDRGLHFYEKFYNMEKQKDGNVVINKQENAMCRTLIKKNEKN